MSSNAISRRMRLSPQSRLYGLQFYGTSTSVLLSHCANYNAMVLHGMRSHAQRYWSNLGLLLSTVLTITCQIIAVHLAHTLSQGTKCPWKYVLLRSMVLSGYHPRTPPTADTVIYCRGYLRATPAPVNWFIRGCKQPDTRRITVSVFKVRFSTL